MKQPVWCSGLEKSLNNCHEMTDIRLKTLANPPGRNGVHQKLTNPIGQGGVAIRVNIFMGEFDDDLSARDGIGSRKLDALMFYGEDSKRWTSI